MHPSDVVTAELPVIDSTAEAEERRDEIAAALDRQLGLVHLARAVLREATCSPQRQAAYWLLVDAAGCEVAANKILTPLFAEQQLRLAGIHPKESKQ